MRGAINPNQVMILGQSCSCLAPRSVVAGLDSPHSVLACKKRNCRIGSFCLDVRTLTFYQLMGFPVLNHEKKQTNTLAGEQKASEIGLQALPGHVRSFGRQERMRSFGFQCSCTACQAAGASKESETRLRFGSTVWVRTILVKNKWLWVKTNGISFWGGGSAHHPF